MYAYCSHRRKEVMRIGDDNLFEIGSRKWLRALYLSGLHYADADGVLVVPQGLKVRLWGT